MTTTTRTTATVTTTNVSHRCEPMGYARENGPHLKDLRDFVKACEGLPDELVVHYDNGQLDSAGRRTVKLSVTHSVSEDPPSE